MAVITKLSHGDIETILKQYPIKDFKEAIPVMAGVENTNYILKTNSEKYVLTLFEKRVSKQDLPFFIRLMEHLANKDFPVPHVIENQNNSRLFSFNAKTGIIISFLSGESIMQNHTIDHMNKFGSLVANIHQNCSDFEGKRDNLYNLKGCKKLFQELITRRALDPEAYSLIDEILNTDLHEFAQNQEDLPKGIIHADLFPDNIFFANDNISGLIDFYFACYDHLAYDLAIAINAWCFENEIRFNKEKALAIINSYNKVRPLSKLERKHFRDLCLLAATRFYLTRLYDYFHGATNDSHINLKNPDEFLHRVNFFKKWRGLKI
ncbi:MAG: homoserine kinase [Rickettsiales bacterium]|nr:homoserine kinase [Rickettsiales bacterium]